MIGSGVGVGVGDGVSVGVGVGVGVDVGVGIGVDVGVGVAGMVGVKVGVGVDGVNKPLPPAIMTPNATAMAATNTMMGNGMSFSFCMQAFSWMYCDHLHFTSKTQECKV
jgi:hypothetical protein